MQVVNDPKDFVDSYESAKRRVAHGVRQSRDLRRKFIKQAHIEVQLLGDRHGNLVHLFERLLGAAAASEGGGDRPRSNLPADVRNRLCEAAVNIGAAVKYDNAGTVEFLVDADTNEFYFIEVNPRIKVEHTVTEEVTGIDIVRSQILIAQGEPLGSEAIGIPSQQAVETTGFAIQSRVTTEDPSNRFMPDYGRVTHYRSAGGMGVRLDAGTAFSGAVVFPYYDSLLVKVSVGAELRRRDAADGTLPAGVPHSRREDEHSVPDSADHRSDVRGGELHDAVHRRDAVVV